MAAKKQATVVQKEVVIRGEALGVAVKRVQEEIAARRLAAAVAQEPAAGVANTKRSKQAKVIVKDGVDFAKLGAEMADLFLDNEREINEARAELEQQARVSRGELWLIYAERCSDAEQVKALTDGYREAMNARGHKRAASDASDFKAFALATLKNRDEVIGALAESGNYHEAMKAIREIKNDGQTKPRGNGGRTSVGDKAFAKIIESVAYMNAAQLTRLNDACISRAKVLRSKGEIFQAFAAVDAKKK